MRLWGPRSAAVGRGTRAARCTLRAMAETAYVGYQATRYDDTGRMLPALIREAEAAGRAAGSDSWDVCPVRAMVYDTAAALLHRVGESSLAWTAADRALAAAEQSGRPELVALQAYRLSYVISSRRHPAEALELAMPASAGLERTMRGPDVDTLSVYGGAAPGRRACPSRCLRSGDDREPAGAGAGDRRADQGRQPDGDSIRARQRRDARHLSITPAWRCQGGDRDRGVARPVRAARWANGSANPAQREGLRDRPAGCGQAGCMAGRFPVRRAGMARFRGGGLRPALGEAGLAELARLVEERRAAGEPSSWTDGWGVGSLRKELAALSGDVDAHVAVLAQEARSGRDFGEIVSVLRAAGRDREAEEWARKGLAAEPLSPWTDALREQLAEMLLGSGRR